MRVLFFSFYYALKNPTEILEQLFAVLKLPDSKPYPQKRALSKMTLIQMRVFAEHNTQLHNETAIPKSFQFPVPTAASETEPTSSLLIRCQTKKLNINTDRLYYSEGLPPFAKS